MNRSYRLKIEDMLSNNILTQEILINCCAKYNSKISRLAYNEKCYKNYECRGSNQEQLQELIDYRKPFMDVLMREYKLSLDVIKDMIAEADVGNIPTKKIRDQVRDIILNGNYQLE